uniref:Uncharacterized protein n=1 Tax=Brassica oleracea var. oleracea TaxID=109376 RepID=A0A0D3C0X2_BRAOL
MGLRKLSRSGCTQLPELGANYGNSLPNNSSPPILAYKGRKGRRQFKEAILSQSESVNGTNTRRKNLPEDKGPDVPAYASSSKDKAPEPSLHIDAWINVLRKR